MGAGLPSQFRLRNPETKRLHNCGGSEWSSDGQQVKGAMKELRLQRHDPSKPKVERGMLDMTRATRFAVTNPGKEYGEPGTAQ